MQSWIQDFLSILKKQCLIEEQFKKWLSHHYSFITSKTFVALVTRMNKIISIRMKAWYLEIQTPGMGHSFQQDKPKQEWPDNGPCPFDNQRFFITSEGGPDKNHSQIEWAGKTWRSILWSITFVCCGYILIYKSVFWVLGGWVIISIIGLMFLKNLNFISFTNHITR